MASGCDLTDKGKKNIIPFALQMTPKSGDASLRSLAVEHHAISPSFDAATTEYSIVVRKSETPAVTVRAIGPDGAAVTIAVNGGAAAPVAGADYSAAVTLDNTLDTNTITIAVASEDGVATREYVLHVYYFGTSASLSGLSAGLTGGSLGSLTSELTPVFDISTRAYTLGISFAVTSIDITASVPDGSGMTIMTDGWTAASGAAVPITDLPASGASRAITVAVTSQDKSVTNTYTITVTRGAAPSSEARLASMSFKYKWGGLWYNEDLSPEPTPAKLLSCFDYAANFSILVTSTFRFTLEPVDGAVAGIAGRVSVDGGAETGFTFSESSGVYAAEVTGGGDGSVTEVFIDVTAENGTTVVTYKVTITVE